MAEGLLSPELLVWKAQLLQLAEDGGSLEEIEATLQYAIELDATYVGALLELGWFRLNVLNDASRAFNSFQKALNAQASTNTELVTGLLKCLQELKPNGDLDEAKNLALRGLVDEAKLNEALRC